MLSSFTDYSALWNLKCSRFLTLRWFEPIHGPEVIVCNTFLRQPGVSDTAMEQLVRDKVEAFRKGIETLSGSNKRGQVNWGICLLSLTTKGMHCQQINIFFSEKRPKKSWFPVYMGEEEVPWEKW